MSDPIREFMSRVVPWPVGDEPGFINLHWLRPNLKEPGGKAVWSGKATRDVDSFLSDVRWGAQQASVLDIYYCLSLQSKIGQNTKGKPKPVRLAENALAMSAIWIDVDVKPPPKGYATLLDAVTAINDFVKAAGLPRPSALVASGGGVHVYWFSNRRLSPEEWRPFAFGLKAAVLAHGLLNDAGVIGDMARVLRVPGTYNYKTEPRRVVKLLGMQSKDNDYGFVRDLSMLPPLAGNVVHQTHAAGVSVAAGAGAYSLAGAPASAFLTEPLESLAEGLERRDLPPLTLAPIEKECAFIRDALATGGKDYTQPMWNLTTLAATWMEDGNALAHRMGERHPGYTRDSTESLWNRKNQERRDRELGWPSCVAVQDAGCTACATCPIFARGKSPLNLAVQAAAPTAAAFTAAVTAASPAALGLPNGYALDKDGHICKLVETQEKGQPPVTELFKLFTCTLSAPWTQRGPDALNFATTVDLGTVRQVSLPMTDITGGLEMWKSLLRQGVKALPQNKRFVEGFLMAWLTKLHDEQEAMASMPFGWYEENGKRRGFIYGGLIMKDDGTERPSGFGDAELRDLYKPTGTNQPWFDACKLITDARRPALEAIVAASFAAPLMVSTGEYSGLLSAWGTSGVGKSTAIKVAQAVWSHPKRSKEVTMTTARSVVHKLGKLRHLPVYWDEIKDAKVQEKVFETIFGTEGVGPGRLNANIQQQARDDWQTMLAICSNISFVDYLNKIQATTNAGMYRVFEYHINEMPFTTRSSSDASRLMQTLESNFGGVGLLYAKMLALDPIGVDNFVNASLKEFSDSVQATPGERIWVALGATIIAGATLANKIGATFDVVALKQFMTEKFLENRRRVKESNTEGGTVMNTEEILTGFLKLYVGHTVWTDTTPMGAGKPKAVSLLFGPKQDQPKPIYIQYCVADRLIRIAKPELIRHLDRLHISVHQILSGLETHFNAKTVFKHLCAGTPYRCGQENLIHIPVPPGSSLEQLLNAHAQQGGVEAEVVVVDSPVADPVAPPAGLTAAVTQATADLDLVRSRT